MTPEQRVLAAVADYENSAGTQMLLPLVADAIRAAVAEEREACAMVADLYGSDQNGMVQWIRGESAEMITHACAGSIAAAIRARGESRPLTMTPLGREFAEFVSSPQPDAIAEPSRPLLPSFIWGGRLVKVEDGNFVMSRVGKHDDFDFAAMDKEAAVAGNPGGKIRAIEQIDDVTLRLLSDVGTFTLIGGPDLNTWVIGADIKLGREPSHDV